MPECWPRSNPGRSMFSRTTRPIVELLIEHGPNLKLPYSRAFGDGLFELRPRGRSGIGRAFYCFLVGRRVIVLHAFIKKSQQTPDHEIRIARTRLKEIQNG